MFVILDIEPIFHMEFVAMFTFHLQTKYHIPSSNNSLVMAFEPNVKSRFHETAMLLFHILPGGGGGRT
jgi:hypothetical protein